MTRTARRSVKAFLNNEKINLGNTRTDGSSLILFGHTIAEKRDHEIYFSLCGYNTTTTKDRLNELLSYHGIHIRQKNYIPYLITPDRSFEMDTTKEYCISEVLKNE